MAFLLFRELVITPFASTGPIAMITLVLTWKYTSDSESFPGIRLKGSVCTDLVWWNSGKSVCHLQSPLSAHAPKEYGI